MASRNLEREKLYSLFSLYEMEREAPDARDGLPELRQAAMERINRLRLASRSRTGRLEAVEFVDGNIVSMLEDTLAQESDTGKIFDLVDGIKARTLLDQIRTRPPKVLSPATARQVDALEREIMSFKPGAAGPDERRRALQLASQLEISHPEHIDEVENLLATSDAGFVEGASAVSLADVSAALRAGEVLIEYCMPSRAMGSARLPLAIWALVITQQSTRLVHLGRFPPPGSLESRVDVDGEAGVDFSPITSLSSALSSAIRTGAGDMDERLNDAYELLISPLIAAGLDPGVHRHWIIVPDAALHTVPFAALRDADGQYLGVKVAMTIVPSASVWHHQQQAVPQIAKFLGFGNPRVPGLQPLPFAEDEVREVSRLLRNRGIDCKVFLDVDATESRLKETIVGHHILHIAAHGAIATADAFDFHDLMLASTGADDGRLHAHELRTLDLRETSLAVLSVCDSGTYRFGAGNELHGLMASLLIAGVHDVLGTLWPVNDALASRLIVRFYTYLLRHGAAEALRRARADLIGQGAQVVDWASFLVVGHGRGPAAAS